MDANAGSDGTDGTDGRAPQSFFDAHSDIPNNVVEGRASGRTGVVAADFLPGMREGRIDVRVAALFVDGSHLPERPLRRALDMYAAFSRDVAETPALELATSADDLAAARSNDRHTFVLGMEGAEPLMGDLRLLDVFYDLGLRLLTLTHSRRNAAADGCFYEEKRSGTPGGLTEFGVDVVERLDELGVVLDVSHLNRQGFRDVVEFAPGPFVASHSNCTAVHDHPRNVTDDQIRAVADAGGVVGLTPVADFVDPEDPDLDDFLDHVDHAVSVAGVEHVGFGFDFFEYMAKHRPSWDEENPPFGGTCEGVGGDAEVPNVPPALRDRGYSDDEIERLCRGNFLELFRAVIE